MTLSASASISRATGSETTAGLSYAWTQQQGPTAVFVGSATAETPLVSLPAAGAYLFELTVTDANGVKAREEVWVSVGATQAAAPVAVLQSVSNLELPASGSLVLTLSGRAVVDGTTSIFYWAQSQGSPSVVETPSSGVGQVTLTQPGTYTFLLRVAGADGVLSPATETTFVVSSASETALASGSSFSESSGGCSLASGEGSLGSFWGWLALGLGLLVLRLGAAPGLRPAKEAGC